MLGGPRTAIFFFYNWAFFLSPNPHKPSCLTRAHDTRSHLSFAFKNGRPAVRPYTRPGLVTIYVFLHLLHVFATADVTFAGAAVTAGVVDRPAAV